MEVLKSIHHPTELWALIRYNFVGGKAIVTPKLDYDSLTPTLKRCYELLNQTSRSFAAVIQALDEELRPAVCIFYLILRALDTVEDDMSIPEDKKVPMLKEFYTRLQEPQWKFMDSKEKDKAVLEEFPVISAEFRNLKPAFQDIISDITCKMGSGMTVFLQETVESMEDWDEYCHYVAGLVGIGLSRLFLASGLEGAEVGEDHHLANNMGLFLQKTNIIRDYLEDVLQGREFWPKKAWGQFALQLRDFQNATNRAAAVKCLNLLITDTLKLVPDVMSYMSRIQNQSVFNFCAIPQTMAIATLALCYNNPAVFTSVVKIRKGQAVQLIMNSGNMDSFKRIMACFTAQIMQKLNPQDPSSGDLKATAEHVLVLCGHLPDRFIPDRQSVLAQYKAPILSTAALFILSYLYWSTAA